MHLLLERHQLGVASAPITMATAKDAVRRHRGQMRAFVRAAPSRDEQQAVKALDLRRNRDPADTPLPGRCPPTSIEENPRQQ